MTTTQRRITNRVLWTAQALVALLFLFAGAMKFTLTPEQLQGPFSLPLQFLHFIGAAEIAGALGLVLPGLARIRTGLTPLAALGLLVIMLGATVITTKAMGAGPALFPFAIGLVVTAIAWGRWRVVPLRERRV